MMLGTVSELWRYPVSSLGGERLVRAEVGADGIAGDRIWGMAPPGAEQALGPDREKRWRIVPEMRSRLAGDAPEIDAGSGWLPVTAAAATAAASAFLGHAVVLAPHPRRGVEGATGLPPRYRRAGLHLLTTASLKKLRSLLPDGVAVDARRFRPNLVIRSDEFDDFVEQGWIGRRLTIGAISVRVSEPCARCSFTALAQSDLTFAPEVLHAVTRHGGGDFGVYAEVEQGGTIDLGDAVSLA